MVTDLTDRFDGIISSLAIKAPCKAVATTNITLSGEQTVGGVAVVSGDRVLVIGQTIASENGIYDASTSAWQRAADWDGSRDVVKGTFVTVANANVGRNPFYQVTTDNPITIGTTSVSFTLADGPNVSWPLTTIEAGAGLTANDIDDSYEPGDVRRYDTVQAALDSGHAYITIVATDSPYEVGNLDIPSTVRAIRGIGLPQVRVNADEVRLFDESALTDVVIEGIDFRGFPSATENSNSRLMVFENCTRLHVRNNRFEDVASRTVMFYGCTWSSMHNNDVINCTNGLYLDGCQFCSITKNRINGSQAADATFKVGILLAPFDATYGHNEDCLIAQNTVYNLQNSQAIIAHTGRRITIVDNKAMECSVGISLNPIDSSDTFEDIIINGFNGTGVGPSAGYTPSAEYGLQLAATAVDMRNVSVSGVALRDYNNTLQANNQGAISVVGVEDLTIDGFTIRDCHGSAIVFSGENSTNVKVSDGNVRDISGGASDAAIKVDSPTTVTGRIESVKIAGSVRAYRIETSGLTGLVIDGDDDVDNTSASDSVSRAVYNGVLFPTSGDTTPSVAYDVHTIRFQNGVATTVTNLDNGYVGQVVTLLDPGGNTTLSENSDGGGNFRLSVNTDFTFGANDTMQVVFDGTDWQEVSRSAN